MDSCPADMQFALLASGSKGNCFLLKDGSDTLMVDCGTTRHYLTESFQSLHLSAADLSAVLITHGHSDHISQLNLFRQRPVYSPIPLEGITVNPVTPFQTFRIGRLAITPLPLSHDAINTTGYIFRDGDCQLDYITDTGYLNESYLSGLKDADYIVMESNHDLEMLMNSRRPQYVKARICSDFGHLCNEDCAAALDQIVTPRTRMIILAHISEETNTRQKALRVSADQLLHNHAGMLNPRLVLCAAGQYEMIRGGETDEEVDPGSCRRFVGMESVAELSHQPAEFAAGPAAGFLGSRNNHR